MLPWAASRSFSFRCCISAVAAAAAAASALLVTAVSSFSSWLRLWIALPSQSKRTQIWWMEPPSLRLKGLIRSFNWISIDDGKFYWWSPSHSQIEREIFFKKSQMKMTRVGPCPQVARTALLPEPEMKAKACGLTTAAPRCISIGRWAGYFSLSWVTTPQVKVKVLNLCWSVSDEIRDKVRAVVVSFYQNRNSLYNTFISILCFVSCLLHCCHTSIINFTTMIVSLDNCCKLPHEEVSPNTN